MWKLKMMSVHLFDCMFGNLPTVLLLFKSLKISEVQ